MAADQNRTGRDLARVLSRAVTVTGAACWTVLALAGCGADGPSNAVAPHDGQIGYFPTAVGIQWVYDQPVPDFGVVTLTQEISAAEPVSGGTRVTLLQQSSAPDGSRSTSEFVFEQTDDGAVRVPFQLTAVEGEDAIGARGRIRGRPHIHRGGDRVPGRTLGPTTPAIRGQLDGGGHGLCEAAGLV